MSYTQVSSGSRADYCRRRHLIEKLQASIGSVPARADSLPMYSIVTDNGYPLPGLSELVGFYRATAILHEVRKWCRYPSLILRWVAVVTPTEREVRANEAARHVDLLGDGREWCQVLTARDIEHMVEPMDDCPTVGGFGEDGGLSDTLLDALGV